MFHVTKHVLSQNISENTLNTLMIQWSKHRGCCHWQKVSVFEGFLVQIREKTNQKNSEYNILYCYFLSISKDMPTA